MLICQVRILRQFSRNTFFHYIRDLVAADGWTTSLSELRAKEDQIDKDLQSLGGHVIQAMQVRLQEMQRKFDDLGILQQRTLNEVQVVHPGREAVTR